MQPPALIGSAGAVGAVRDDDTVPAADALRVVDGLPESGRALVVGHSPTNEAAVLGLAGRVVPPLGGGPGVLLVKDSGD